MNLIDTNNESLLQGLSGNKIDLGKSVGATIAIGGGPVQISSAVAIAGPLQVSGGIGFYGASILTAAYSTVGLTTASTAGTGATVLVDSTFTGSIGTKAYTLDDLVAALKKMGLIAS